VSHAAAMLKETRTGQGLFEAEVIQSFEKIGCWMTVKNADDDVMRVFMKDPAFFIPKDSVQCKAAFFFGKEFYDNVSIDLPKYLLMDARP
jgi:hypothetical protein